MSWGEFRDRTSLANPGGQGLFDLITAQEERLRAVEDTQRHDRDQWKRQINSLQEELTEVKLDINGYRDIRRRFWDFYKRDVHGLSEFRHTEATRIGNAKAHAGDVVADAALWRQDRRRDHLCFTEIYGLRFDEVLEWQAEASENSLFLLLNAHACLAANRLDISAAFRSAFRNLIVRVQESWLQPPSKAEPGSPLRYAYDIFVLEYNADIERLNPPPWLRVKIG